MAPAAPPTPPNVRQRNVLETEQERERERERERIKFKHTYLPYHRGPSKNKNLLVSFISGNLIWTELMVKEKKYFENDHFANLKT